MYSKPESNESRSVMSKEDNLDSDIESNAESEDEQSLD